MPPRFNITLLPLLPPNASTDAPRTVDQTVVQSAAVEVHQSDVTPHTGTTDNQTNASLLDSPGTILRSVFTDLPPPVANN